MSVTVIVSPVESPFSVARLSDIITCIFESAVMAEPLFMLNVSLSNAVSFEKAVIVKSLDDIALPPESSRSAIPPGIPPLIPPEPDSLFWLFPSDDEPESEEEPEPEEDDVDTGSKLSLPFTEEDSV